MSMESDVERSEGTPVRESVKAAVATHSDDPDTGSILSSTREHHAKEIRERNRASPKDHFQLDADRSVQLRSAARNAYRESLFKAAAGPTQPAKKHEAKPGAPDSWGPTGKAMWQDLPEDAQLNIKRDEIQAVNAYETRLAPHLQRLGEIDQVLAPARGIYSQHGLSDAQAVDHVLQWEAHLRNPQTQKQAFLNLAAQHGVSIHELAAMAGGYPQPQQYPQEVQPQFVDPGQNEQLTRQVHAHLSQFSQTHQHYESAREAMGLLLQIHGQRYRSRDGRFDLEKAYRDACRNLGLGGNQARHAAAVSPRSHAPVGRYDPDVHGGRSGVRASIENSIADLRARA